MSAAGTLALHKSRTKSICSSVSWFSETVLSDGFETCVRTADDEHVSVSIDVGIKGGLSSLKDKCCEGAVYDAEVTLGKGLDGSSMFGAGWKGSVAYGIAGCGLTALLSEFKSGKTGFGSGSSSTTRRACFLFLRQLSVTTMAVITPTPPATPPMMGPSDLLD